MRARTLILWVAVLPLMGIMLAPGLVSAAAAGPQFSLKPVHADPADPVTKSYFVLDTAPGKVIQSSVLVSNTGESAGTARLYAVDATTGATSGAVYPNAGAAPREVGSWIHLDQSTVTLDPGQSRVISFTVTVPSTAQAGQHLGGIVAEDMDVRRPQGNHSLQLNVVLRSVIAVQVNVPGPPVYKIAITGVSTGGSAGHQTLLIGLRNDGNRMVKPKGMLSVVDTQGHQVQHIPLSLDTFVPQTAIHYPVYVRKQALGAGKYQATIDLTYGPKQHVSATMPFTVTKADVSQVFSSQPTIAPPASLQSERPGPQRVGWWSRWWPAVAGAIGGLILITLVVAGGVWYRRRV